MDVENNVTDLGVAEVGEPGGQFKKKRGDPVRHSGFFITINTNYRPKAAGDASSCAETLRAGLREMYSNDGLARIVDFLPPYDSGVHHWDPDTILKVTGEFVVERGTTRKGGRIHSHATLHIDHQSKIRLNIAEMKDIILAHFEGHDCGVKTLYVHIDMITNNLAFYLRKDLKQAPEQTAPGGLDQITSGLDTLQITDT